MKKIILQEENIYTGNLILVNEEFGIRGESPGFLIPALDRQPEILLQRSAATLLNYLMQKIRGWQSIVPVSGFRSFQEQQAIWDDSLRENGREFTEKYVALPGHSEHQTGLAIDLGLRQDEIDFICPEFPDDGICRTFRQSAAAYGFILRYPAGKKHITGIEHEPWHFRYVGTPHAQIMEDRGLTLEEYIDFLRQFSYGDHPYTLRQDGQELQISFLSTASVGGLPDRCFAVDLPDSHPYTVSGNNVDGFILTEWRQENARTKIRRA